MRALIVFLLGFSLLGCGLSPKTDYMLISRGEAGGAWGLIRGDVQYCKLAIKSSDVSLHDVNGTEFIELCGVVENE